MILHRAQQEAQGDTPALSTGGGWMSMVGLGRFSSSTSPEEKAVAELSKAIAVKVGRNTSVIDFRCDAANALLAQQSSCRHFWMRFTNNTWRPIARLDHWNFSPRRLPGSNRNWTRRLRVSRVPKMNQESFRYRPSKRRIARSTDATRIGVVGSRSLACILRGVDFRTSKIGGRSPRNNCPRNKRRVFPTLPRIACSRSISSCGLCCTIWSHG